MGFRAPFRTMTLVGPIRADEFVGTEWDQVNYDSVSRERI